MNISCHKLQYDYLGFRINGGLLHSYPTLDDALDALDNITLSACNGPELLAKIETIGAAQDALRRLSERST